MRNKWIKRFVPLLALLLLALWPVAYAYAHTDDMSGPDAIQIEVAEASTDSNAGIVTNTSGQAGQVIAQEPIHTLSARLASNNVITAPDTELPSHVYVLNNREIMTEVIWSEINKARHTAEEPSSDPKTTSARGTIRASVTVTPARIIVVDDNDRIVEIWSNTTGMKRDFYSLRIKEQSLQGLEHCLTQQILAEYNRLLGEVDWTETGRVY